MKKQIFVLLLLIMTVLYLYKSSLDSVTEELEFRTMKIINASGGQKPKHWVEDDDSYSFFEKDPFQHRKQLKLLGNLVHRRLHYLQNPSSCNTARKLKCRVHTDCGFGCQTNTVGLCLMIGYATNRTVIVEPSMTSLIQSLSSTCTSAVGTSSPENPKWDEDTERFQVIDFRPLSNRYRTDFFPPAIPEDLADTVVRFHGNPFLWWAGQITGFVFRPTKATSQFLKEEEAGIGFTSPIVGVQIRRTDKLKNEAKYHHVDEYMVLVEKWYDNLEKSFPDVSRRLFLATDDPGVKQEIRARYPKYKILNNDNFTRIAEHKVYRNTESGYLGIISDLHMLSKCDYLVCTFSSNVCLIP